MTERTLVPDDRLTIRERAIAAWPTAWHGQNLREILMTLGYEVDTPWRDLPKRDRDWILFTDEQPTVPVYSGFDAAEIRSALKRKDGAQLSGHVYGREKICVAHFRHDAKRIDEKTCGAIYDECRLPVMRRQTATAQIAVGQVCRF